MRDDGATDARPPVATDAAVSTRDMIIGAARRLVDDGSGLGIETVARAAGVSRSTFYRHFRSRSELLAALDLQPDPATRDRVLEAAAELIGRDGLRNLSMDELAARAGVSRASVYRLFPGKPALFEALVAAYSPFEPVIATVERMRERPAQDVLPAVVRVAAATVAPRVGIVRSLLFEVTAGAPEAVEGARGPMVRLVGSLGAYLVKEMEAGRVRRMHPLLAVQSLVGPLVLHLMTRPTAANVLGESLDLDAAVAQLARTALEGLSTGQEV